MSFKKKRKDIVICIIMWMKLEDIMQSEISQSQKDKYCIVTLRQGIRGTEGIRVMVDA